MLLAVGWRSHFLNSERVKSLQYNMVQFSLTKQGLHLKQLYNPLIYPHFNKHTHSLNLHTSSALAANDVKISIRLGFCGDHFKSNVSHTKDVTMIHSLI